MDGNVTTFTYGNVSQKFIIFTTRVLYLFGGKTFLPDGAGA